MDERIDQKDELSPLTELLAETPGTRLITRLMHFQQNDQYVDDLLKEVRDSLVDPGVNLAMKVPTDISLSDPRYGAKNKLRLAANIIDIIMMSRHSKLSPDQSTMMVLLVIEKFLQTYYKDSFLEIKEARLANDTH